MAGWKKKLVKSNSEKLKLIEPSNPNISIIRQCELLKANRSSFYYQPQPVNQETINLMNRIDEIYTKFPYYGSPRITAQLNREGITANHKRIERLMRIMGIQAIYPKPNTSKRNFENTIYPYLLKGIDINYPNQIWGTDITYIRANNIWFYLTAILDWHSRYVISWKLSDNLSVEFCIDALEEALKINKPEIHNSDQGSQFTSDDYLSVLKKYPDIKISMDSKGRCFDNIFTERLWRTVKYEEVYLNDYNSYSEAKQSLGKYFKIYNNERLHQSLDYHTPAEIYFDKIKLN